MKKSVVIMFMALFVCNIINAQRYFETNDIRYRVITDADESSTYGTVSVAKPEVGGYEDDIVIPNVVKESNDQYADAYRVVGIDEEAFSDSKYLKSVSLPPSIEFIGDAAFQRSSLERITIPTGNLSKIGNWVFQETKIESIELPPMLKKLGANCFAYCYNLRSVKIGEGLEVIEEEAFKNCYSLETISFPKSLRILENDVFSGCFRLNKVDFFENLKSLGDYVFFNCKSLRNINLPEGIKVIGEGAFLNAGLEDITIPKSVREIGSSAFANTMVRKIIFCPGTRCRVESFAFSGLHLNGDVTLPHDALFAQNSFENTIFDEGKRLAKRQKFIESHNKSLMKIMVKEKDLKMVAGQIHGQTVLLIINGLPYEVTLLPIENNEYGILKVSGLSYSYVVGRGDEFWGPEMKKEEITGDVVIPDVIEILDGNFKGKYIVTAIGPSKDCKEIGQLRLPLTLEDPLMPEHFSGSGIISINIPEQIIDIPERTFYGCMRLEKVELTEKVKTIGKLAFSKTAITNMKIPNGVEAIEAGTFENCSKLESVIIPSSVKIIGSYAFAFCEKLLNLDVPKSVTTIEYNAFRGSPFEEKVMIKKEE